MTSTPRRPKAAPKAAPADGEGERSLRLPAHCVTTTAEELRVRLVLAADLDEAIEVDASQVESVGQAVLQLLLAARAEAAALSKKFAILHPSPAFVERVTRCRLADALGLDVQKEAVL